MEKESLNLKNGDPCSVVAGTHNAYAEACAIAKAKAACDQRRRKGKSGTVQDLKWSKTGHITITVLQANGERFKTLGRNVSVQNI